MLWLDWLGREFSKAAATLKKSDPSVSPFNIYINIFFVYYSAANFFCPNFFFSFLFLFAFFRTHTLLTCFVMIHVENKKMSCNNNSKLSIQFPMCVI